MSAVIENTNMLVTEFGVVTKIFDYISINNLFKMCDDHCHNLKFERNKYNITKAVEDISTCPFFEDCKLLRYELPQSKDLLEKVNTTNMTNDEIWEISAKLEEYFKDSKIEVVNKQMKNFVQANSFIIIFQALNLLSIYSTIKEAGKVIENENLFDEIKEKINQMQETLDAFRLNNEQNNWRRVIAIQIDLNQKMNKARTELSKLNINLGEIRSNLQNTKKQSETNMLTNSVNFLSSIISLVPTFQLASNGYKVLSLLFGPVGYGALVAGNAKAYLAADQKLKDLVEKQNELDNIARQIDEIADQMRNILIN